MIRGRIRIAAFGVLLAGCGSSSPPPGSGGTAGSAGTGGDSGVGLDSGVAGAGGPVVDASMAANIDAATGCGLVSAPTGVLGNQTITVGDLARSYVLSVPKSYDPSTPLALVFGWHGSGASGNQARQSFAIEPAAAGGAIFVYPSSAGLGWDWSPSGIDVALFDALAGFLTANYCVDRKRIFSTGMSNGAYFTNVLACYRGDVLRAIAPVAGGPPSPAGCIGHVGAWVAHASNDDTVDFTTGGLATRDLWLGRNGCSSTLAPLATSPDGCVEYQGCQPEQPVVFCVYSEGHTWPSMANCYDGGVCFDAGPAIWAFFARFK